MKVFRERPRVIYTTGVWVVISGPYMYVGDTLLGLLVQMVTEWRSDRHLAG